MDVSVGKPTQLRRVIDNSNSLVGNSLGVNTYTVDVKYSL